MEKKDKDKLDRIDITMEKLKGTEELLVDIMKERYECGAAAAGGIAYLNLQRRSEIPLQRRADSMEKRTATVLTNLEGIRLLLSGSKGVITHIEINSSWQHKISCKAATPGYSHS